MNEDSEKSQNIYPRVIEVMNTIYHHNAHPNEPGTSTSHNEGLTNLKKVQNEIEDVKLKQIRLESELKLQSAIIQKLSLELGIGFEINSQSDGLVQSIKALPNNIKQELENLHSSQQSLEKTVNILYTKGTEILTQFEHLKRNVNCIERLQHRETAQIRRILDVINYEDSPVENEDEEYDESGDNSEVKGESGGFEGDKHENNEDEEYDEDDDYEDEPLKTVEKINFTSDKFPLGSFQKSTSYTWIINVDEKYQTVSKTQLSPTFVIYGYKIDAQAQIKFEPACITISLCLVNSDRRKNSLSIPLPYPTISYKLLDSSDNETQIDIHRMADISAVNRLQNKEFSYKVNIWTEADLKQRYVKVDEDGDPCISMEIVVDWPDARYEPFSFNGSLLWEVRNYRHKLKQQRQMTNCHYSPYFYTSENGYRVKSGLKIAEGISVMVEFVSGKFDKFLDKKQKFLVTVTLIDKVSTTKSIRKSAIVSDLRSTTFCLVQPHKMHNIKNYIRDDTLLIKVLVEPV
ncbi:hypothetical protein CHUAL_003670 [Chamberlinius hualienensis]